MKKILGYFRMPRWTMGMLLVLVLFVSLFGFAYRFYSELNTINLEADISRREINETLNLSNEYIEMLSIFGQTTLENNLNMNKNQFSLLKQINNSQKYAPDFAAVQSGKLDGGTLSGNGELPQGGSIKREVEMALGFNRFFKRIKSSLSHAAWVYYTSKSRFQDIYPGDEVPDFSFNEELTYNKDFYYLGKPSVNPERKRYWSSVYPNFLGKGLVTTVSKPIYDKNEFKGVVSIDLTVLDLSEHLNNEYYCFITNPQNQIVSYSKFQPNEAKQHALSVKDVLADIEFVTLDPEQLLATPGKKIYIAQNAYVYTMKLEGAPWTLYVVQPLHMVIWKVITYSYPVLLIGILLLFAVYENAKVKHQESQLQLIVGELELSKKELERLSTTDPMSGALNRRGMYNILIELCKKSSNSSFILCDIDRFKQINDKFGHDVGDRMIMAVSESLKQNIRSQDFISRWGGEEFLMFLPDTDRETALAIASRLREEVENIYIYTEATSLKCTMSFGIAHLDNEKGIDRSIKNADIAMYRAKEQGRNNVCVYD